MDNKIQNYNIEIFENLKEQPELIDKLFKELTDLQVEIQSLIERKGKTFPAETVKETIIGLGKITPVLIIANQPYPINQATLTSGSQAFQGKPVMSSGQLFDSEKYEQIAIVPIPREVYTLVIPGTAIALDTYKEQNISPRRTLLTLKIRDYPFVIDLELDKGGGGITVSKIDPNKADVVQLKMFEDLLRGLYTKKRFEIYNQKSEKVFLGEGVSLTNYSLSEEWYSDVSDLAFIQEATSISAR